MLLQQSALQQIWDLRQRTGFVTELPIDLSLGGEGGCDVTARPGRMHLPGLGNSELRR